MSDSTNDPLCAPVSTGLHSTTVPTTTEPGPSPNLPTEHSEHTDVSDDDRDVGWGDPSGLDRDRDEWYRRERPPHHG